MSENELKFSLSLLEFRKFSLEAKTPVLSKDIGLGEAVNTK